MLLLDAFRVHALHSPGNAVAYSDDGEAYVYRQIWNVSELLGAHLIEQTKQGNLGVGEPVLILTNGEVLTLACIMACAKSGHAYVYCACGLDGQVSAQVGVPVDARVTMLADVQVGTRVVAQAGAQAPKANELDIQKSLANSGSVILVPTTRIADALKDLCVRTAQPPHIFDAQLMLSYIVPGMTDDFSCGCGDENCEHGPFLQECMPAQWLKNDGNFAAFGQAGKPVSAMSVAEHDEILTAALMTQGTPLAGMDMQDLFDRIDEKYYRSRKAHLKDQPFNLCNPHFAVAIAKGESILKK